MMALLKGLPVSCVLTAVTSAIRFGCQTNFNLALAKASGRSDFQELSLATRVTTEAAGGFVAGIVLPFLFTPLELVKSRQQINLKARPSSLHIISTVLKKEGLRGMYAGHSMTLMRSTLGNAVLFGSYELFKGSAARLYRQEEPTPKLVLGLCGVLAGWSSWLSCFPLDAVKTRMQVNEVYKADGVTRNMMSLYKERALYRGLAPVLARAVPVHAAYLPIYDIVMQWLCDK